MAYQIKESKTASPQSTIKNSFETVDEPQEYDADDEEGIVDDTKETDESLMGF